MNANLSPGEIAGRAGDHPVVLGLARVGFVVSGLMHLLLGWIALQLAWTGSGGTADTSGALGTLAATSVGKVLLWVGVVGFLALGLWQLSEAVTRSGAGTKVKAVSKAVVYLALGWSAFGFARGAGQQSREQSTDATATLMGQPFGAWLVMALGAIVVAVGIYHVVKGARKKFLDDLERHPGTFVERAGVAGYVAKGVALVIVGGLFVLAGWQNDPQEASGLDGALRTLLDLPLGMGLLTVVALGLIAMGVYNLGRARYAKL